MKFNDWINLVYEDWFEKFCQSQNTTTKEFREQFPEIATNLHAAFRIGWLSCENFYS